ncbi:uncharacterized protein KD926_007916 [Aspergillus affinis]|uniref:uncharacterized protein n=1 Tax=Aspergillus affinis TaxID=1070780 RepID=UPI0022FF39F4|nr:uncharacterized protein KD926_007916 [Aspergillus affinis]KAI9045501.1 hypothetical protein KD926_007916 [Aspergillus affinis]
MYHPNTSSSAESIISLERDHFDVTFHSYPSLPSPNDSQPPWTTTSTAQSELRVPVRLHHIHLGGAELRTECLKHHPAWEPYLWDDVAATRLVRDEFPDIHDLWENYPYLVQRVDALRYVVLYKHGGRPPEKKEEEAQEEGPGSSETDAHRSIGAILDFDLVERITHDSSNRTIYTMQHNRTGLRILSGPPTDPNMHMLNGFVDTPLFQHLGKSSWHAHDVAAFRLLNAVRRSKTFLVAFGIGFAVVVLIALGTLGVMRRSSRRGGSVITKAA